MELAALLAKEMQASHFNKHPQQQAIQKAQSSGEG